MLLAKSRICENVTFSNIALLTVIFLFLWISLHSTHVGSHCVGGKLFFLYLSFPLVLQKC